MNAEIVENKQAARYGSVITADATADGIPDRIEVMRAGSWPEQNNKGRALTITATDLQEFVDNFKAGIGVPGGSNFGQIPIDFAHKDALEAAGWITNLEVEGNILFADVTWTAAGRAALEGGMFKCFSPSFWPACLGEYPDPENHQKTARNVLCGGGLTNIPFFKDLTAIMASNAGNSVVENNKARKDNTVPTLDEVRIKDVASLTADDKKVLEDNRDQLSADEQAKFFAPAPEATTPPAPVEASHVTGLNADDAKLLADMKSGKYKMIEATQYDAMSATVDQLKADAETHKVEGIKASVEKHVARGAIKADQVDGWTTRIAADSTMSELLEALPGNKLMAAEIGNSKTDGDATSAFEVKVKAKMDADSALDYATAVTQVANEDADLANGHEQQVKN